MPAVSSALAKAWKISNSAEPSTGFGSPGSRESVTIENTSLRSSFAGANSGMVLS